MYKIETVLCINQILFFSSEVVLLVYYISRNKLQTIYESVAASVIHSVALLLSVSMMMFLSFLALIF
jgi:hypothetical protein